MNQGRNTEINSTGRGRSRARKRNQERSSFWLIIGGIIVIILTVLIVVVNIRKSGTPETTAGSETALTSSAAPETETADPTRLVHSCVISLSRIPGLAGKTVTADSGMNRTEVLKEIQKAYEWDISAVNTRAEEGSVVKPTVSADETTAVGSGDQETSGSDETEEVAALREIIVQSSLAMDDLILRNAEKLVEEIFAADSAAGKGEDLGVFELEIASLDEAIEEFAQDADDMWYVEAKGGSIESYDPEKDEFLMEGSSTGYKLNKQKLIDDLSAQIAKGNLKCRIPVVTEELAAEEAVPNGEYQIIASYVTHTTNNSVRNNNVRLACEKLNGTIIRPGEEFSYNYTIGERTAQKGYGEAAAYQNGEVVQEIGGGVCQVSSTLYNAVTEAGLKTTYRSPHTFKPTYVTPGQDATVSWNGPDYRFANVIALPEISYDSTYAIGIRAVYQDQTVTVTLYGRPVLKPGYRVTMESEMTGETEVVRETIPEGSEKQPTTGDKGSTWKTYLHITKDGSEVSRNEYHTTRYKGHTEYYYETLPESSEESVEESTIPEGAGPGYFYELTSHAVPETSEAVSSESSAESGPGDLPVSETTKTQVTDTPGGPPGYELPGNISPAGNTPNDGPEIIEDGP